MVNERDLTDLQVIIPASMALKHLNQVIVCTFVHGRELA